MVSRYLIIVLAAGAAFMRISQGAWIEATGLFALALGLLALQGASRRPGLKPVAWGAFGITGLAMVAVLVRMRLG